MRSKPFLCAWLAAPVLLAGVPGRGARGGVARVSEGEKPRARAAEEALPCGSSAMPFARVARAAREFRYAEAERVIAKALDAPPADDVSRLVRARFAACAAVVRLEADHFRRVAARIRSGDRRASLGFRGSTTTYTIRTISEGGLTVTEGEGELEFAWDRVPARSAYALMMSCGGDRTSVGERLAVAVFAHHRGLTNERDHELDVAAKLARSPEQKTVVRHVCEVLDRLAPAP
jgi:hypothetical protein